MTDEPIRHLPPGAREFVPETEDREAWAHLHAFRLEMHRDLHPEDAYEPDEVAEAGMKRGDPFHESRHLVLARDGRVISRLVLSAVRPASPAYESNRHHVEIDIGVVRDLRRQGIATDWLGAVVAFAADHGARLVSVDTDSESGRAFVEHIGGEARLRSWDSRLWFERANWDRIREWAAIDPGGQRIEAYEPFPPQGVWDDYARGYTELVRHVPREDAEIGDWILTPERMREDRERFAATGRTLHVLAAWDGRGMTAVTEMMRSDHDADGLQQELTAVHPRARGRGLAKLLKARLLLAMRDRYPSARYVRTYNAGSNDSMWAINEAMGFGHHRLDVYYQVEVARLRA